MRFNSKEKLLIFILFPAIITAAIAISLVIWANAVQYTIWKVALVWGFAIIVMDILFLINSKIPPRLKAKKAAQKAKKAGIKKLAKENKLKAAEDKKNKKAAESAAKAAEKPEEPQPEVIVLSEKKPEEIPPIEEPEKK